MATGPRARRSRHTGSLFVRRDGSGRETWYARYYVDGRQRKRAIGLKRVPGTRFGMTRAQAEAALRRLIDEARSAPPVQERLTVAEAGGRHLERLEALGRKRSTIGDADSCLRIHLVPFFGGKSLDAIARRDVEAFVAAERRAGRAPKSIRNYLSLLNSILELGVREGWCADNSVRAADKPPARGPNPDIRFLDNEELEALLQATGDHDLGRTDRALFIAAATTGLRLGELRALSWRDVDWIAGVVRVRRSFTRGEFGTPKSRRSSRAVPMADRLAGELDLHFRRSRFQADDDLVFGHPVHGGVLDGSALRRRFKAALRRAGVRDVRLHDLRHSFATRMAAAGAPLRAIQEWMGHRDYKTTSIYADYAPDPSNGGEWARRAFGPREDGVHDQFFPSARARPATARPSGRGRRG